MSMNINNKKQIKVKKLQGTPYAIDQSQIIGQGSFAKIVKAYNTQNLKQDLVAKVISCKDQQKCQTIKTQLLMLKQLPYNPNLVNCVKIQISSEKNFYMIMEYCNQGNLAKYLFKKKYQIPQERIWFFLKQFCEGYQVLFQAKIIHRDLKPQNIMIHNGNFKIADFGLARLIDNTQILQNLSSKGTPLFMAPQLGLNRQGNSKVDVFSLGIILYKMAFNGKHPYFQEGRSYRTVKDYFSQMKMKKLIFPQKNNRSIQLTNLIKKMLQKDPQERIGWKQIFQCDKIKRAVRYQRRNQILPMDQFKDNLIIANNSFTHVELINKDKNLENTQNQQAFQMEKDQQKGTLIIQETFNRKNKTKIEQKLYQHKLLYTLIQYTNKKSIKLLKEIDSLQRQTLQNISKANKSKNQNRNQYKIFHHLKKVLNKVILQGYKFSLFILKNLETISGDWSVLNNGQVMNFQDIFDGDKDIILNQMKKFYTAKLQNQKQQQDITKSMIQNQNQKQKSQQLQKNLQKGYINGQYQNTLYLFLSEYNQYPQMLKKKIKVCIMFLIDIYDLVLKYQQKQNNNNNNNQMQDQNENKNKRQVQKQYNNYQFTNKYEQKSKLQKIYQENYDPNQFRQYLIKIQNVTQNDILKQLKLKGLLVL